MNVVIDGKLSYQVNDNAVTFTWFEGQGWTKEDLDAVLAGLVSN